MEEKYMFKFKSSIGLVYIDQMKKEQAVFLQPCFPWSSKKNFFSIKNTEGEELVLLEGLSQLDDISQKAVRLAQAEAGFCFNISKIDSITTDFELRSWKVMTDSGFRSFQTNLSTWPIEVPSGGLLIQDLFGDQYYIESPKALDKKSQESLWAFL